MSLISLDVKRSFNELTERYFSDVNKDPFTGKHVPSHNYIFIDRKEADGLDQIKSVDLSKIVLWDPTSPDSLHGVYAFPRRIKEESQGKLPLGLAFAEAILHQPWPEQWNGVNFVGCAGTIVSFSRAHRPVFPRLERNVYQPHKVAMRWWPIEYKLSKNLRIAFYPTGN